MGAFEQVENKKEFSSNTDSRDALFSQAYDRDARAGAALSDSNQPGGSNLDRVGVPNANISADAITFGPSAGPATDKAGATTNPDGSITTEVKEKNGLKQTTALLDGSATTTYRKNDGSVNTLSHNADGRLVQTESTSAKGDRYLVDYKGDGSFTSKLFDAKGNLVMVSATDAQGKSKVDSSPVPKKP